MLVYNLLHNNKRFLYIEYALYKLDKTKIVFENHYLIDLKLFPPMFNYSKFYTMTYFVYCKWNLKNAVNYNTKYSKIVHKYFFEIFYSQINKKKYKA